MSRLLLFALTLTALFACGGSAGGAASYCSQTSLMATSCAEESVADFTALCTAFIDGCSTSDQSKIVAYQSCADGVLVTTDGLMTISCVNTAAIDQGALLDCVDEISDLSDSCLFLDRDNAHLFSDDYVATFR